MEGFNAAISVMHAKARIGILGNNQDHWESTNSRIGFGTGGKSDDSNTCGNNAENTLSSMRRHGSFLDKTPREVKTKLL